MPKDVIDKSNYIRKLKNSAETKTENIVSVVSFIKKYISPIYLRNSLEIDKPETETESSTSPLQKQHIASKYKQEKLMSNVSAAEESKIMFFKPWKIIESIFALPGNEMKTNNNCKRRCPSEPPAKTSGKACSQKVKKSDSSGAKSAGGSKSSSGGGGGGGKSTGSGKSSGSSKSKAVPKKVAKKSGGGGGVCVGSKCRTARRRFSSRGFLFKTLIAGGVAYGTLIFGVWGSPDESNEVFSKVAQFFGSFSLIDMKDRIQTEAREQYNNAVKCIGDKIQQVPVTIDEYYQKKKKYAQDYYECIRKKVKKDD